MEKSNSMSVLFYLKQGSRTSKEIHSVMMRVTINGKRAELSTKLTVQKKNWNSGKQIGQYSKVKSLNQSLDALYIRVQQLYNNTIEKNANVTSQEIIDALNGKHNSRILLLEVFKLHNQHKSDGIDVLSSDATHKKFATVFKHTEEFISYKYNKEDILISDMNHQFGVDLRLYLMKKKKHNYNTVSKYIKCIKTVINFAKNNKWITQNPLDGLKCDIQDVERVRLMESEILQLRDLAIDNPSLERIRDVFVFCCYTGLAYAEVNNFKYSNIEIREDNRKWIKIRRQKTPIVCEIPILDQANYLIEKYKNNEEAVKRGTVFPVISNQKLNTYLKVIAKMSNLDKNLSFHIARHSFATLMLTMGASIESVSKILGHKSIRTTQIYAKMVSFKLITEMDKVQLNLRA